MLIELGGVGEFERVDVVAWRQQLDAMQAWVLRVAQQPEVRLKPAFARYRAREPNPDHENDARFLRVDRHRAERLGHLTVAIEDCSYVWLTFPEVVVQLVLAAGMPEVLGHELVMATRTRPERLHSVHYTR